MAVQRGRSKRRGEAYSEYVEPLNDARTKLADFFNILLGLMRVELADCLDEICRRADIDVGIVGKDHALHL